MPEYIKPSEHVFVAGKTGTGKTWLARKYLTGYKNVVCLDTKGTTIWPELPGTKWNDSTKQLIDGGKEISLIRRLDQIESVDTPKLIYRPDPQEMTEEYYDAFFKWVYYRRHTVVWIDELLSIGTPYKMPFHYKACLTRGRELNVGVWSLTQRPSGIPTLAMSEATHFIVFDLNMPQDRHKIAEITGMTEFLEKPSTEYGKYSFWYHNVEHDSAIPAIAVEKK